MLKVKTKSTEKAYISMILYIKSDFFNFFSCWKGSLKALMLFN